MATYRLPLLDRLPVTQRFSRREEPVAPRRAAPAELSPAAAKTKADADLVVVGAGPGGWAAALSALKSAKGPFKVVVLDKRDEWTRPQVVMLTRRTMRHLKQLGVNVKDERFTPIKNTSAEDLSAENPKKLPLLNTLMRGMFSRMVPINGLQEALQETALDKQIVLRTGVEAHDLDVDPDGVTLKLKNEDGSEGTLRARYVGVADGAKSVLRDKLGIAFNNFSEQNPGVIGIVNRTGGDVSPKPGIHISKVTVNGEKVRMIVQETPKRASIAIDLPPHFPTDDASVAAHLREAASQGGTAGNPDEYSFEYEPQMYVGQLRRADRFHEGGRAFLLGDSAHTTVQASGMGVNLAVRDGETLGKAIGAMDFAKDNKHVRRVLSNLYSTQVVTSAKLVHATAKRLQMAKPSFEARVAAEANAPSRNLKVRGEGEKALQKTFSLASSLPPERLWEEITRSIRDSDQGKLWVHSLERAKLVSPELKTGSDWAMSYLGTPPVFYRFTNVDPAARTLSYAALDGHTLTGGGKITVVPEGNGGSRLNWDIDYSGPKVRRMFTRALTGTVERRMQAALREVEKGDVYGATGT